ncbi:T9SS type A sorting domain-containing protein [Niastella caeni]|nr:T9SS type A sorting domain-containing protein [Niastella caeni]
MKKVTSTITMFLLCLYVNAQIGSLDPTFNASGTPGFRIDNASGTPDGYEFATSMAITNDGKLLVAGRAENDNYFLITRYTMAGEIDATFGAGGVVKVRSEVNNSARGYGMVLQPDGKIVLAGWNWPSTIDFCVMRFNADGSFDNTFGTGGKVTTPIGAGNDEGTNVALQNDGKIVVTGSSFNASGNTDYVVLRYTATGVVDSTFGTNGIVITDINAYDIPEGIAINSTTGAITIAGTSNSDYSLLGTHHTGNGDFTVVRYTSSGALDGSFGTGGIATFDISSGSADAAHSLAVQPDGKLIVAGTTVRTVNNKDVVVIRLTTAGALDPSFGTGGIAIENYDGVNSDDDCRSVALQSDGKIVIGGNVDAFPNTTGLKPIGLMLMRFTANGALDPSFNGDGKTAANIAWTDNDFGMALALSGSRIYLAGSSGQPKDLAIAAFQNSVGGALPVVLTQFYAQKQTSKVNLQWQTSSEENVKQFVIERSNDGKNYKAIGTVAAAGNSTLTKNYTFADQSPFTSTNNYYRLLMQDVDGKYKYSKILIIKFDGQLTTNMQVFPSYVRDILQVQLPNGLNGNVSLQVIDMNGRVVKRNNLASDGSSLNTTVDVSNLTKGVYILKAQAGNTSVISRFTKQ